MTLEDEVKRLMYQETMSSPPALQALVTGGEVPAGPDELFQVVIAKTNGLEQAIIRLAQELDQRS